MKVGDKFYEDVNIRTPKNEIIRGKILWTIKAINSDDTIIAFDGVDNKCFRLRDIEFNNYIRVYTSFKNKE